MNRVLWAFGFGAAVTGAQALGPAVAIVVGAAVGVVAPAVALAVAMLTLVLATGVAPAVVHSRLSGTRFASTTSMRTTILLALGGLALGHVVGAVFEPGHFRGGGWQSLIGAILGSFFLVSLANLRARRPEGSLRLGVFERP